MDSAELIEQFHRDALARIEKLIELYDVKAKAVRVYGAQTLALYGIAAVILGAQALTKNNALAWPCIGAIAGAAWYLGRFNQAYAACRSIHTRVTAIYDDVERLAGLVLTKKD